MDQAFENMTAEQAKSFASRQRDLLSSLTDTERINLARGAGSIDALPSFNAEEQQLLLSNIPHKVLIAATAMPRAAQAARTTSGAIVEATNSVPLVLLF